MTLACRPLLFWCLPRQSPFAHWAWCSNCFMFLRPQLLLVFAPYIHFRTAFSQEIPFKKQWAIWKPAYSLSRTAGIPDKHCVKESLAWSFLSVPWFCKQGLPHAVYPCNVDIEGLLTGIATIGKREVVPFTALNVLCTVSCNHELCYFKTSATVIQKRNYGNFKKLKGNRTHGSSGPLSSPSFKEQKKPRRLLLPWR